MRKVLVIGIILLFIGASIVSGVNTNLINNPKPMSRGWLYVGGSGPGNYSTIQSAINAANSGDTVFVYSATYYECISISKSLNLVGEDKYTTIINANFTNNVIYISDAQTTISGFTICYSGGNPYSLIRGDFLDNSIIQDNFLYYGYEGISLNGCYNVTIKDNYINTTFQEGIRLWDVYNSTIEGNTILTGWIAIWITGAYNILNNNTIKSYDYGVIFVNPSTHHNIFSHNIIQDISYNCIDLDYRSHNNSIYANHLSNSSVGIEIADNATNNIISENIINKNQYGIRVAWWFKANNNSIYHNNFLENNLTVFDNCSNSYNNSYPSGGNYWDDYNGYDYNHGPDQDIPGADGIGDIPYNISGESNQDFYPFIEANGWEQPSPNQPPASPIITGPAQGKIKVAINYFFTAIDPDDDNVSYYIDWGDNTNSGWIGLYYSGEEITQSHTWSKKGDYTIKAKAKDIYGNESDWGQLSVIMPYSYNIQFLSFWEKIHERFPNAFLILRYILG